MLPQQLVQELQGLRDKGYSIEETQSNGLAHVIFHDYPVPPGYSESKTDLLLRLPMFYPNGKLDMFWTDNSLTLMGGNTPKRADVFETFLDRKWRRFSWHLKSWNPGSDNLITYLEFVNTRLAKAV